MTPTRYRVAGEGDFTLVINSWVNSYRTAHTAGMIAMRDWKTVMVPQVERVLARPGVVTWVACHPAGLPGETDLLGWIAVERGTSVPVKVRDDAGHHSEEYGPLDCPLVHYVYVKEPYRKSGLARSLFRAAGVDPGRRFLFTCKTAVVTVIRKDPRRPERQDPLAGGIFAPLIARFDPKPDPCPEVPA